MSYFVVVSFDIANGTYENYQAIYVELERLGLSNTLTSTQGGEVRLPSTTAAGEFNGESASSVRDYICEQVKSSFVKHRIHGEIFAAVGGDWAWGHRRP